MKQIDSISKKELHAMATKMYGLLVKGVVDIKKEILVIDAEMHVDIEQFLLNNGSKQNDLWGINLYPNKFGQEDFIEFDSMINIRPSVMNFSRDIEDPKVKEKIYKIVNSKINE